MITHYLVRSTARGEVYWKITQDNNITFVESGQLDKKGRKFPPIEHDTENQAHQHFNRQIQQKLRQGFRKGRQAPLKRTSEFEEDYTVEPRRKATRALPEHYDGEYYDDEGEAGSSTGRGAKRKGKHADNQRGKKARTMEEEVLLANARADALRLGVAMPMDDDDDDTDSLSSAASSSYGRTPRGRRFLGVSPLNKRRSMRLALKRDPTLDMADDPRQSEVEMTSPNALVRMNTQKRWCSWRPKRQATSSMLKAGTSVVTMDTLAPKVNVHKPTLLKRLSTTTFLRQALAQTNINKEEIVVPKVFDGEGSASKQAQPNNMRKSMRRLGTRTTVQVLPSLNESESPDTPPAMPPALTGPASCSPGRPPLRKRPSTSEQKVGEPRTKRTKRAALQRCQSISAVTRQITLPPRASWPVKIGAQVVWRVPLIVAGLVGRGRAVCVQTDRCMVADDGGKVIVVDEKVSVKHVIQLPSAINHFCRDGQFVYVTTDNGQVYDISQADPRLVFDMGTKNKDNCVDVYDGVLLVCDVKGHVVRYDHHSQVLWKTETSVGQGFVVRGCEDGVLCCSSMGVTSFSLRDGTLLWETPLRDNALDAVLNDNSLYVTCGSSVLRVDTATGDVTKTYKYPKQGKYIPPSLTCLAVGGGLVFACGQDIVCYEEKSGDIVFVLKPPVMPCIHIQYFEGRIFCVGDVSMSVADFSSDVIAKAQKGEDLQPVDIRPKLQSPIQTPLQRLPTVSVVSQEGAPCVVVECFRPEPRKSRLKVRAVSQGYNGELDVQFPSLNGYAAGSKFVVHDLKRSETGGFYRVLGDIRQVDNS